MNTATYVLPVRCFTCGNVIADMYTKYDELVQKYSNQQPNSSLILTQNNMNNFESPIKQALDNLQINNLCCRRMFMCKSATIY